MTFLSMIGRFATLSALFLGAVALSSCLGSGGDSSGVLLTQQAYLKASNTGPGDLFSTAIAFDGDTLVVGAPFEDSNVTGNPADNTASGSGAVYVFTKSAGVWSQQAYLKASNIGAGDNFGTSVALDGDTLVVGSPFESSNATGVNGNQADNSASGSGAVYVFTRSGGVWSQQAYLKASNAEAGDNFGTSVALNGNMLVVGSPFESSNATGVNGNQADNSASGSGAVYVFTRSVGVWSQQAYVKASNTEAGDQFGKSVALSGETLVVGASGEDSALTGVTTNSPNEAATGNGAGNSGAVYVLTRSAGVWSQQAYLKASNAQIGDDFGGSVALSSDTLVVGASLEDSNATGVNGDQSSNSTSGSGAAYVFTRSAGVWTPQVYLKASNSEAGDQFGYRVSVSAGQIAVGANVEGSALTGVTNGSPNEAATGNGASISGAVYLFAPQ